MPALLNCQPVLLSALCRCFPWVLDAAELPVPAGLSCPQKLQQLSVERTDLTAQVGRLEKEARQRTEQVSHLERQLEDGLGKTIRTPGASAAARTPGAVRQGWGGCWWGGSCFRLACWALSLQSRSPRWPACPGTGWSEFD